MIRVLSVPYALAPVGMDCAGGAEVVLAQIDRALVERGHRSLVVGPEGSRVAGTLLSTGPLPSLFDERTRAAVIERARRAIIDALAHFDVDVVHLHGLDFAEVVPPLDRPVLITLHMPIGFYSPDALLAWSKRAELACVSRSQASALPAPLEERAIVVENGVDLERYRPRPGAYDYALTLGRICPEKNFPDAIDAAKRAHVPLLVAGQVHAYDSHERHFRDAILPRLGPGARFLGPVRGARKIRLLSGARCVLVPSLVQETSSLVALEALASGTPVIAYRAGALADIVEDGRTGFLVDDVASMAEAIANVGSLDRSACRESAERRFDLRRTTSAWISRLEALAEGRHAA